MLALNPESQQGIFFINANQSQYQFWIYHKLHGSEKAKKAKELAQS